MATSNDAVSSNNMIQEFYFNSKIQKTERQQRKKQFNKKLDSVYCNPTIFKVHNSARNSERRGNSLSINTLSPMIEASFANLPNTSHRAPFQVSGPISPNFNNNTAATSFNNSTAINTPNQIAIQENLAMLKKEALKHDRFM